MKVNNYLITTMLTLFDEQRASVDQCMKTKGFSNKHSPAEMREKAAPETE